MKEPGAEMRAQAKQKEGAVRRKQEKCNRYERALLLLIIGGVMCQHSLTGFRPEGTIPQGPRH